MDAEECQLKDHTHFIGLFNVAAQPHSNLFPGVFAESFGNNFHTTFPVGDLADIHCIKNTLLGKNTIFFVNYTNHNVIKKLFRGSQNALTLVYRLTKSC